MKSLTLPLDSPSFVGISEDINCTASLYRERVLSYVLHRVRDEALADDICQEVFIRLWVAMMNKTYVETNKLLSFLMRVARNLIVDYFRSNKKVNYTNMKTVENQLTTKEYTFDKLYLQHQQFESIEKGLVFLSSSQKEVIQLRYFEGKTFSEIAEDLGVNVNTILSRHYSALGVLKKKMNKVLS